MTSKVEEKTYETDEHNIDRKFLSQYHSMLNSMLQYFNKKTYISGFLLSGLFFKNPDSKTYYSGTLLKISLSALVDNFAYLFKL